MRQYIVDAFADRVFEGNPAAVCVLDRWPEEDRMMRITRENNLSETAFAVPEGEGYRLRWFTPSGEIDLCGHATLAAAFVITEFISPGLDVVLFDTLSGRLTVRKRGELLEMDFPAYQLKRLEVTDQITEALGARPSEVWRARDPVSYTHLRTAFQRRYRVSTEMARSGYSSLHHCTKFASTSVLLAPGLFR